MYYAEVDLNWSPSGSGSVRSERLFREKGETLSELMQNVQKKLEELKVQDKMGDRWDPKGLLMIIS